MMRIALVLAASAFAPLASAADAVQSLDSIRVAAEYAARDAFASLGEDLRIGDIQIDSRLRVAACAAPLQARLDGPAAARSIVAVSCPQPVAWTLRIPVHAQVWRAVAVNKRAIRRGAILAPDQIDMEIREVLSLSRGYFGEREQVVGQQASRNLKADQIVHPGMIEAPRLIKRGDPVVITADGGRIAVRTQGIALQDGTEGDSVQVRNPRSGRVITGEVTARGTVSVLP
ncbi:MAG: flagella basal body P-ring formation protein FlgA [Gammaproteobacteria bacterium HGW-Gammaproteobacteria-4]|jgi:flagella basal body P-ring formation protein FlgA|nr:MAG: flagella basal body P-ring formation protein FlgA [Gammaproteobacteria bacterium HGW-Gammaproteobacteria-4]